MSTIETVLSVKGITKRFGSLTANDSISFTLEKGKVLALLGENGAGKTTLMNIIFGHYLADEGTIEVFGEQLRASNPAEAISHGIGMVHQHFTLADNLTVLENITLGTESLWRGTRDTKGAKEKIKQQATEFGLSVDPDAYVKDLSVGEKQRVEILKALYRGARILILDEPTAVLTPQEADQLFATLRDMLAKGLSVIFISHKLGEVMAIADEIAVLRHGKLVADFPVEQASREIIAEKMVGEAIEKPVRTKMQAGSPLLYFENVTVTEDGQTSLKNIQLHLHQYEIIGIAGVSGNGQKALSDLIAGLSKPSQGSCEIKGEAVSEYSPAAMIRNGVGRVPEDRHVEGAVGELSVEENLILEDYHNPRFSKWGWLNAGSIASHAKSLISAFDVRGAGPETMIRSLSGGNMQKVILARALENDPDIILANQPTRGLDVGAATFVHEQLFKARARGAGVILISEDLEELLSLADKVVVMYHGMCSVPLDADKVTQQEIGLLMSGEGFNNSTDEAGHAA
ncbi:ATP-binding cassette domain-containing protein [Sneathiella sp. P13V-1]|uniref:ABC transporter ATP-binding protein n=1 Tax=Sneathiella sp. P13V-1 TaxID=2697366 RepID=UPI00187BAE90|nr:ABC transporter ATP-binding protein [Sneathiella sp. P13V-1]MBE7635232.1 ATP-binding cassette domain-containing protein [Sneathiella sp. P13V-1]